MTSWIRGLARFRWLVLLLWIAITAVSLVALPDLQQIVRKAETNFLPNDSESLQANQILKLIDPSDKVRSNAVISIHREGGLTETDKSWITGKIDSLNQQKEQFGVISVMSAYNNPDYTNKFRSQDHSTELVMLGFATPENEIATQENVGKINELLQNSPDGTKVYLTGSAPIAKDFQASSEEGLKKTEIFTVILVLVILLVVFRTPVAPIIPLVTIGISLLITRGLVALSTEFGVPVSSFTQSFLIAVLFGAGTDYCILIIQRYREELASDGDKVEALIRTMRNVGKTVIFSASTVFVAFFLIGFATFGLYQSAAGVAIGMAVTLLAGLTLTPALLMIFGKAAFWPVKVQHGQGHKESKLWMRMANLASKRPVAVILVVILVLSPFIALYQGQRSFDNLAEIDPKLGSVKGFKEIEQKFGSGEVFPVTAAITSTASMRSPEALAALEQASEELTKLGIVHEVRSAVRPLGKQLKELTMPEQVGKVSDALSGMHDGVTKIADGLGTANSKINDNQGEVQKLIDGMNTMSGKTREAQSGLKQIYNGYVQTEQGVKKLSGGIAGSKQVADSMAQDLSKLLESNPDLAKNPAFQMLMGKQKGLADGLSQLSQGALPLQQGFNKLNPSLQQVSSGLGQLADGQQQAANGTSQLQKGFGDLTKGLKDSVQGLNKVADGLEQVQSVQKGMTNDGAKQISGWYLPKEAFESKDLQKAINKYMSEDGKTTKFEIILSKNPYSNESIDSIGLIRSTLLHSLQGSVIETPGVMLTGTTAGYSEMGQISQDDFKRTGTLVLIGIFIVLALLLRSILAPLYVLLSLGFNYFVTMGIVEFIFVKLVGYDGLSWSVAFFIFLINVALGVDYSIFLMARFKEEYRPSGIVYAMSKAMSTTGGVIISAAVIMGGTFAALMLSGVTTLLQIGAGILVGLLLYSTIFMGLLVPAFSFLLGEANWWPFQRSKAGGAASISGIGAQKQQAHISSNDLNK